MAKAYFLVGINYGSKSTYFTTETSNSIYIDYNGTKHYYSADDIVNLKCLNYMMAGNLDIGFTADKKTFTSKLLLSCKSKIMTSNVNINILAISGSNYDIITDTQYWTVPYGITAISVCCVGGGGGGGASHDFAGTGASLGSAGGGGGYVVTGSYSNLTAGTTFVCNIGAGGTGGKAWTETSLYARGCGTAGEATYM